MEYPSHTGQDQWVCEVLNRRPKGFFLDFGAFDGVTISNTLYLEQELGWQGICVEPNPTYYPQLCAARKTICINAALWPESNKTVEILDIHGLSSVREFAKSDKFGDQRVKYARRVVEVGTINPTELLDRFEAPRIIEYMSLDVEGCEFDIVASLDLNKYHILLMTIEHNGQADRMELIRNHLGQRGYKFIQHYNDDLFYRTNVPYPTPPEVAAKKVQMEFKIRNDANPNFR